MSIRERLAAKRSIEKSGFRWRGGDVTRLEQFSDAVFAFALALLVVASEIGPLMWSHGSRVERKLRNLTPQVAEAA